MANNAGRPGRSAKHPEGVLTSDHIVVLFEPSERARDYRAELLDFMDTHVYPAEPVYEAHQMRQSGNFHHQPQIIETSNVRRVVADSGTCFTRTRSSARIVQSRLRPARGDHGAKSATGTGSMQPQRSG